MLRKLFGTFVSAAGAAQERAVADREQAERLIAQGSEAEAAGDAAAACGFYRQATHIAPQYARAHLNLGTALEAVGDLDGALQAYERACTLDTHDPYASYNLGRLLYERGAIERAAELLRAAIAFKPHFPEALLTLASVLESRGELDGAARHLEMVLEQRPQWSGALLNYSAILQKLGRVKEAESALRRVIEIEPRSSTALYGLANLLLSRRAWDETENLLRRALTLRPDFADAHAALFHVHEGQGNLAAAASALEAALRQRPDWAEAFYNYGITLKRLRRLTEAEAALRRAVTLAPHLSFAHEGLGAVLFAQGRVAEALVSYGMARELDPTRFDLESGELFVLNHSDGVSGETIFNRHRAFGARIERAFPARFEPLTNDVDPHRRLRVGYVSGDFNHHPVTFFLLPLLERHDRSAFEIVCYALGTSRDGYTEQVRDRSDAWREAESMSSTELASQINNDAIDVLVDLSGHSGVSRLAVFAQRPAPVQASWLGYPATTGLTRIQYRLVDAHTDPPGATENLHTETLLRLRHSQWCYRPPIAAEGSRVLPLEKNGHVTFGSFNQMKKLSPSIRALWCEILRCLPTSRMVIAGVPEKGDQRRMLRDFHAAGVDTGRVAFLPHVSLEEYFRRFCEVDIALDTSPYSGCTTTFDTLWMGVPVVTLTGDMPASRVTAGILRALGLEDWIASSPGDYVRLAVDLARDPSSLVRLRESLRATMRASPIMDEGLFARDMEDAYRTMWRAWCSQRRSSP